MSWSVSAIGKPTAVKNALVKQFEQAKSQTSHIPAETESVTLIEQLVNKQLDFLAAASAGAVKVVCSGSCSPGNPPAWPGSTQVKAEVETIYGFVE